MNRIVVEAQQGVDDMGEPEVFTFDLFALVPASKTSHLDENGLPRIGTRISPGMVIIGKVGKSNRHADGARPNSIEASYLEFNELRERFGSLWNDTSVYATPETSGVVVAARLQQAASGWIATVEIERGE